ncbi:hypothetical protein [Streptomyces sp. NPDC002889]|uniref:hypothetical protein n=1 Tax=Streptomyces sp. NPDC002889 TaxID=3364669 RepID=UPI0036C94B8B
MNWYVGVPVAGLAVLVAVAGAAAVRTGWVLPAQRGHVLRPRLFGYALLVLAACLGLQLVGAAFLADSAVRSVVTYSGAALMLAVAGLILAAQRPPRVR